MASYDKIMEIIHNALSEIYTKELMTLWLNKLELVYLDEKSADFTISDSQTFVDIINKNYSKSISDIFYNKLNMKVTVTVYSEKDYKNHEHTKEKSEIPVNKPLENEKIDDIESTYSPKYDFTFDNFIVGNSNKFAYNACISVANDPASNYNPLFIYGDSGLGKTHLMKAIVNKINELYPDMKQIFVTGEMFTNEFVASIRQNNTDAFHEKYRNADILLIDDIQFIAGRVQTQEEFFHTFNILYDNHKQIVLTSDRPPKFIANLTQRLETRFEGGLMVDIQPPDTELKIAILQSKSKILNVPLTDETAMFIVENVSGSIRKLEGIIKKIGAYCFINNTSVITLDMVKKLLDPIIVEKIKPEEIAEKIINSVSIMNNITVSELKSKSRKGNVVRARNIAIYAIREKTSLSLESIGRIFDRDHTTVINSIDRIRQEKERDSSIERDLQEIYKDLN